MNRSGFFKHTPSFALALVATLALAGCPADDGDDEVGDETGEPPTIDEAAVVASALDYADGLTLINAAPFASAHEAGIDVNVFVDPVNVAAYAALDPNDPGPADFPEGTLVVKEHLVEGSATEITIMYKGPAGFDPEHRDWWWGVATLDGTVQASGAGVATCIGCHESVAESDYLYGVDPGNQN
ncbi:MAG: cytochrome P460 family protein [Deltaproteobacteria bacterium]|nr:cytochrome P460 family protein [Deltaproteobacteria bacterium]